MQDNGLPVCYPTCWTVCTQKWDQCSAVFHIGCRGVSCAELAGGIRRGSDNC
jgi:hypothetical protein